MLLLSMLLICLISNANPQGLGLGPLLASLVGAAQVGARVTGQVLRGVGLGLHGVRSAIVQHHMMFGSKRNEGTPPMSLNPQKTVSGMDSTSQPEAIQADEQSGGPMPGDIQMAPMPLNRQRPMARSNLPVPERGRYSLASNYSRKPPMRTQNRSLPRWRRRPPMRMRAQQRRNPPKSKQWNSPKPRRWGPPK
ncbi:unnamed protein product [Cylicostephanus goldi]|uniref:Uncharacterized protein n=1 Tax=Cylicostephanus goldi TaxID=71465 RepID=A0A3P7LTC8_CYLGO|nr:unnamed protein product [Cylicostephanus goldi]